MKRRELLKGLAAAGVVSSGGARIAGAMLEAPGQAGIFLNQAGYLALAAKMATFRGAGTGAQEFTVHDLRGGAAGGNGVVFRGELGPVTNDATSGDTVRVADLSKLKAPGRYRIESAGFQGDEFQIGPRVYGEALRLTMRSYYGQRCGCAVDLGSEGGGGYRYAACHQQGAYHVSSGRSGGIVNHRGWHDAGDYGRYVVNSGITTGTLLWGWEMYPHGLRGLGLGIPESGGRTPDYLAEVRWNLEWMLGMQDADGGVWHKQTSEAFCGFVMPDADKSVSYVIGTGSEPYKSTCATADLAAAMAIAARCYGAFDARFAQRCVEAAKRAWAWAVAHPNVEFENPKGISTGGYGDKSCGDEIAWASAELWRTTGEKQYEDGMFAKLPDMSTSLTLSEPGWGSLSPMALWTYAMAERSGRTGVKERIHEATATAARGLIERSGRNGYGQTLDGKDYGWGSNAVAGNQSLLLLVAHHFKPDVLAREAALSNLHYLLGRNCFGISWVTGLGLRPFQHPHHRPSAADGIAAPWPGLLSGGPNTRGGDAVANALAKAAPMRAWVDDERAYSVNEVAINWNAPLVFLLAAAQG